MMRESGQFLVYLAICLVTGMPYVGIVYGKNQTVEHRWQEHIRPRKQAYNHRLERAIREHGAENFKAENVNASNGCRTCMAMHKRASRAAKHAPMGMCSRENSSRCLRL